MFVIKSFLTTKEGKKYHMSRLKYFSFIFLATFLMGSSFGIGKLTMQYFPPLHLIAFRFAIAGLVMIPILFVLRYPFPKDIKDWGKAALIGSLQTAGVMASIFIGMKYIPSGMSSVITFTNPLLIALVSGFFLKERLTVLQISGIVIGLLGVGLAVLGETKWGLGIFIAFIAPVSWTIATILIKKWSHSFNNFVLSGLQMGFGSLVLFVLAWILEPNAQMSWSMMSVSLLLWLGIPASVVQFTLWFYVLSKGDAAKTSSFLFLAPIFGILTGTILLDERLQWIQFVGGALVMASLYLVNIKNMKNRPFEKPSQIEI
jgi:probable blue pigment (indigoidine) exporter